MRRSEVVTVIPHTWCWIIQFDEQLFSWAVQPPTGGDITHSLYCKMFNFFQIQPQKTKTSLHPNFGVPLLMWVNCWLYWDVSDSKVRN